MNSKFENAQLNRSLGQRVKALRENLSLSRKSFAEMIDISEYFLVEIEFGRKGPSNMTLSKLAEALCTTTDFLLRGNQELTDITNISSMLSTLDEPLVKGAEDILKSYINSINYIRGKK